MTVLMSRKLKYFIVSFETRCINLAAEKLCVTRSPLTRVLYELEGMMGDKLFNRRYNKLEPTELACSLYEELKPTYDLLCGVENKFNSSNRMSALELLCDLSVPYVLYQHILIKLKTLHPGIVCRRVFVSNDEIKSLSLNPQTILLSFRKIDMPEGFTLQSEGDDSVFLLAPGHLSEEEMKDFDTMKDIILYIRKDILSSETKGFVTNALKHFLPYVKIQEAEYDTMTLLLLASEGKGMMLIPGWLSSFFAPPNTQKIKIPGVSIHRGLYINKKNKDRKLLKEIKDVLFLSNH